ncbi:XRE family transcriptional regulator [bacterium]|nr:XRE family transcriptional regulator [bacterium]
MFGQRLRRARDAAGMSMQDLATKVDLSANAIKKYEHGTNMPGSENLLKLSKALGVRSEYFFRQSNVQLQKVEYRKRANTTKKLLKMVNGDVTEQAERWTELLDLYPNSPIPDFALPDGLPLSVESPEDIEAIAELVRHKWELGLNPISEMIDTLESKGVLIIRTSVESGSKVDGLAGTIGKTPVVVVSTHSTGDRQRFTLAHELGHLVLHGRLAEGVKEEQACNHFAGAFLLPKSGVMQHLGNHRRYLEIKELDLLKHEFGISMQGVLFRAWQCSVISNSVFQNWCKTFSKKRYKAVEPGEAYPQEKTILLEQLVYRALGEEYIGESKAAELLSLSLSSFYKERMLGEIGESTNQ